MRTNHNLLAGKMEVLKIDSLVEFSPVKYGKVPLKNTHGLVRLLCFEPSQNVPLHKHTSGDEVFYVVSGEAQFMFDEEMVQVEQGSFVKAVAGTFHGWKNGSNRLILISVLIPPSSYEVAEQAAKMEFL